MTHPNVKGRRTAGLSYIPYRCELDLRLFAEQYPGPVIREIQPLFRILEIEYGAFSAMLVRVREMQRDLCSSTQLDAIHIFITSFDANRRIERRTRYVILYKTERQGRIKGLMIEIRPTVKQRVIEYLRVAAARGKLYITHSTQGSLYGLIIRRHGDSDRLYVKFRLAREPPCDGLQVARNLLQCKDKFVTPT